MAARRNLNKQVVNTDIDSNTSTEQTCESTIEDKDHDKESGSTFEESSSQQHVDYD